MRVFLAHTILLVEICSMYVYVCTYGAWWPSGLSHGHWSYMDKFKSGLSRMVSLGKTPLAHTA